MFWRSKKLGTHLWWSKKKLQAFIPKFNIWWPARMFKPSMNILHAGNKWRVQRGFSKNSTGNWLPALSFLGGLYNFCHFVIILGGVFHVTLSNIFGCRHPYLSNFVRFFTIIDNVEMINPWKFPPSILCSSKVIEIWKFDWNRCSNLKSTTLNLCFL